MKTGALLLALAGSGIAAASGAVAPPPPGSKLECRNTTCDGSMSPSMPWVQWHSWNRFDT